MPNHFEEQRMLNVEIRAIGQVDKPLVCRKVLPGFIRACFKNGPDVLGLQVQAIQPELVGVNLVCLWNFISVIVCI